MASKIGMFEFRWEIENLDRCLPWMKLKSPSFVVDSWNTSRWHLILRFRGDLDPIAISFELCREKDGISLILDIKFELSILDKDGGTFAKQSSKGLFTAGDAAGFSKFLELSDVLGPKREDLLSKGTLTACCLMKRLEDIDLEYTFCLGRSRLGLERSSHLWLINGFGTLQPGHTRTLVIRTTSKNVPSLSMVLRLNNDEDQTIGIEISEGDDFESNMCRCEISLVDGEDNVVFSEKDHFWFRSFKKRKQVWVFPAFLRKNELTAKRDLYLPNDTLRLKFEWTIDSGIASGRIESYRTYSLSRIQSLMITMDAIDYDN